MFWSFLFLVFNYLYFTYVSMLIVSLLKGLCEMKVCVLTLLLNFCHPVKSHLGMHACILFCICSMNTNMTHVFIPFLFLQSSYCDISNFDSEFTDEMVPNSVCWSQEHSIVNASVMEADDAFVGFSYAPPSDDSFL